MIRCAPRPLQVVLTTIEPQDGHKNNAYDAYEYTAHSHTFVSDDVPSCKFTYDLSPIQVRWRDVGPCSIAGVDVC